MNETRGLSILGYNREIDRLEAELDAFKEAVPQKEIERLKVVAMEHAAKKNALLSEMEQLRSEQGAYEEELELLRGKLTVAKFNRDAYRERLTENNRKLTKWRRFGRNVIDQVHYCSTGRISRSVYISKETEEAIQEMLDD